MSWCCGSGRCNLHNVTKSRQHRFFLVSWGNYIQAKDEESNYGFMIGGHGMADVMCAPQYGFAYLDTTNDRIRLFYFEVSDLHFGFRPLGTRWRQRVYCREYSCTNRSNMKQHEATSESMQVVFPLDCTVVAKLCFPTTPHNRQTAAILRPAVDGWGHSGIGGLLVGTALGVLLGALLGALLGKCISGMSAACRNPGSRRSLGEGVIDDDEGDYILHHTTYIYN